MILITGATGQLGTAFREVLGDQATYLARDGLDLIDPSTTRAVVEAHRPALVINCAAFFVFFFPGSKSKRSTTKLESGIFSFGSPILPGAFKSGTTPFEISSSFKTKLFVLILLSLSATNPICFVSFTA